MQQLYNSSLINLLNFYLLYSLYILSEILFLKIIFKKFLEGVFLLFFSRIFIQIRSYVAIIYFV